jgi:hypothetical protein
MPVLDLDILKPEEKKIILGGKEFDITFIPYDIALSVVDAAPALKKLEDKQLPTKDEYEKIFNIIFEIFHECDETIEKKWLRRQINWERFQELMPVIFSAIFGVTKKNEKASGEESQSITQEK